MLRIENLSKSYGDRTLFKNCSFALNPKERLGLVGRNGSGKSTLFRIITGEETQDSGTVVKPKNYRIGYLEQHVVLTQETLLEEACLGLRPEEKEETYKAKKILSGLGFSVADFEKSPHVFSGGFHLRLQLCKVLLSEPDLLLLDEPTNYLDIIAIDWLAKFLKGWQHELIIISHDRKFLDHVINATLGITRGEVLKLKGTTQEYYDYVVQQEEVFEKTRQSIEKKKAHMEKFVERFGAKASKASQAESRKKAIAKLAPLQKLAQIENLDFSFQESVTASKVLIQVEDVAFCYTEDKPLISNFNLVVENGAKIGIIGKNGRGKSTLLKLIAKELQPNEGRIRSIESVKMGYFGQTNIDRLASEHTIEQEIGLANPKLSYGQVRSICALMMFEKDDAKKKISLLSGGERSRVLLGKIIATPCNVLLLDEPTNHLDMESIDALMHALDEFSGAVIIVTHDEQILSKLPDKLVLCHPRGQEIFLGNYEEFLAKEGWQLEEVPDSGLQKKKTQEKTPQIQSKEKKDLKRKIERFEQDIMKKENELEKINQKLADAQMRNNPSELAQIAKEHELKKNEIDELFDLLHNAHIAYES